MTQIRDAILDYIAAARFEALPVRVVQAAKVAMADTLACAFIGSAEAKADTVRTLQLSHFGYGGIPIWGTSEMLTPLGAGVANGYQIQCLGHAGMHEATGVQPLSVIVPAVMAYADRYGQVTGEQLITAISVGTDVAVLLGLAATQEARFSRSDTCGAMGAGAAIAKLAGFDRTSTSELIGLIYSQLSGTLKAQVEGNIAAALQTGFSVRSVLTAYDMVHMKVSGPVNVFDGPFGYFNVFEPGGDPTPYLNDLGAVWRIAELSISPVPCGRAAQGAIHMLSGLQEAHGFGAADVSSLALTAPPLVHRQCGRPATEDMSYSYAPQCLPYLMASQVMDGRIDLSTYTLASMDDPARHTLAAKVALIEGEVAGRQALGPQTLTVTLNEGMVFQDSLTDLPGHPDSPISEEGHQQKFVSSAAAASQPLTPEAAGALYRRLRTLEKEKDVSIVSHLASGMDLEEKII